MGILPMEFTNGDSADSLGLTGQEQYSIDLKNGNLTPNEELVVKVSNGKTFKVKSRIDTDIEVDYFKHGGILPFVIRNLIK